ncbi:hypothetical protein Efla_001422 [Eimeria flavescens]
MPSPGLLQAAACCASLVLLHGYSSHAFKVDREPLLAGGSRPAAAEDVVSAASMQLQTEAPDWGLEAAFLPPVVAEETSFVQAGGDDDDDDADDERSDSSESSDEGAAKEKEGGESEKGEESKEAGKEEKPEEKSEKSEKSEKTEEKHEEKHKEGSGGEKRKKKHKAKYRKLMMSREEQSAFILKNMEKAANKSFQALKRVIKVVDYLNGVVALLNQVVVLTPQTPQFAETVMLEVGGNKVSLKGILDEASQVKAAVDKLFSVLMYAKYAIIGSINRAVPAHLAPPGGAAGSPPK